MTPDRLFHICSMLAVVGWISLIIAGRIKVVSTIVAPIIVPALIGILYTVVIATHWHERTGGFRSLEDVHSLFQNSWLLLCGWVHYLAFDLFVGAWECRDAQSRRIPHLFVIPCLIVTFMFGPAGLLTYYAVRMGMSYRPSERAFNMSSAITQ